MAFMPVNLSVSDHAATAMMLDKDAFGVRYVTYRNEDRFFEQADVLEPGLIVWPGGDVAERRIDRYGLEYDDLFNDGIDRPGLSDMMAAAIAQDATLSIILPTARYLGHQTALQSDVRSFMTKLLSGQYGDLPDDLILQVGSEFYGYFVPQEASAATQYAGLADIIIKEISLSMLDQSVNLVKAEPSIAVQMGRSWEEDIDIREGLSELSLQSIDMVIHHRFSAQPQGVDVRMDDVSRILDAWVSDVAAAGGDEPELFVSAWNVAQFTRQQALNEYLEENPERSLSNFEMEARTDTSFESYWQKRLLDFAYGEKHPGLILETFASYAEAGMSAGAVFGVDVMHPGRLSWRDEDGDDHTFVGGEMVDLLYECLEGTRALRSGKDFSPDDPATLYAFEGDDRLVLFVSAGNQAVDDLSIDLGARLPGLVSLWADSLRAGTNPNWMEDFGIPDNPEVDEAAEAATYAPGIRSGASIYLDQDGIILDLQPFEVVRLMFAKTEEASNEMALVSQGSEIDVTSILEDDLLPQVPGAPDPVEVDIHDEPAEEVTGGGGGGGGDIGALLLLFPFLLFLM